MEETIAKRQAAYLLPVDLIRAVKKAAADQDRYPANLVEEAIRAHLGTAARPKRHHRPAASAVR